MEQPQGFVQKGQEGKVYLLKKALYGLKQASLAWNKAADESLIKLGFKRLISDAGIYSNPQNRCNVWQVWSN
jgi:Reverse transcriptase (RNA-dependent DNA polymerase)